MTSASARGAARYAVAAPPLFQSCNQVHVQGANTEHLGIMIFRIVAHKVVRTVKTLYDGLMLECHLQLRTQSFSYPSQIAGG